MKDSIFVIKTSILVILICVCIGSSGQSSLRSWKDINYAGDTMNYHRLDIYLPEGQIKASPVVIYIYGSAWFANDAKGAGMNSIGKALLEHGYAVVTPNHRSSRDATFPAQIHDIKAVIRFIRANGSAYGIDTSFIAISGSSSGGHLASLAGTSTGIGIISSHNTRMDLEGDVGNFTNASSATDAVVDWFGPTDFLVMDSCGSRMNHNAPDSPESSLVGGPVQEYRDRCTLANPIHYADPGDPPFLIFHGMADPLVPHCQSEMLNDALQNNQVPSELILVKDGGHGPGVMEEPNLLKMIAFLDHLH
jgi:acetyl esterase/lipase